MMLFMKKVILIIIVSVRLFAHDMWIDRENGLYTLHYGHLHLTKEHQGKKSIPYDPKKIKKVLCLKNQKVEELVFAIKYPLEIKQSCDQLFVLMQNGYYTKTPYGTKNLPKKDVKLSLKSWKSIESIKRLDTLDNHLLGDGLEFVLLNHPSQEGDKIRLQLFYRKKPLKGALVAYDGKVRGMSDDAGKINLRIKHGGLQNIQATMKQPCDDKDLCDEKIYTTTLNFEVK